MLVNEKNSLRIAYKKLRNDMDSDCKKASDAKISQRVAELAEYENSGSVLVYVSSPIEVDTYAIIEHSFKDRKKVLVPKCVLNTNLMEFYEIRSLDDLEKGAFGIMEPCDKCEKIKSFDDKTCCIVPALAYDKRGYRLGFGKGFYDRFLEGYKGKKIGLCYSSCVVDELPTDTYDKTVDYIVTDCEIICINDSIKKG